MRAKFDAILLPIAGILVAEDQRQHVTFDAFFANTMFHEVAHGLGIKNTINGKGTVRGALKDLASAIEEGKADVLGLYMITRLHERGELTGSLEDYYVTFLAGMFRSVRWGGRRRSEANMVPSLLRGPRRLCPRRQGPIGGHEAMRRVVDELGAALKPGRQRYAVVAVVI
jgi:hypothetical protein